MLPLQIYLIFETWTNLKRKKNRGNFQSNIALPSCKESLKNILHIHYEWKKKKEPSRRHRLQKEQIYIRSISVNLVNFRLYIWLLLISFFLNLKLIPIREMCGILEEHKGIVKTC